MTETTNFGLKKPEETDFYSVDTQNDNMDAIDSVLQEFKDGTRQVGDSAKLGGKDASEYALGKNATILTSLPNGITSNSTMQELLNALSNGTILHVQAGNPLVPANYSTLTIFKNSANYVLAFAKSQLSNILYYGGVNSGVWSGWNRTALNTDLANYLPLSGGRLTDRLTVHNNIMVTTDSGSNASVVLFGNVDETTRGVIGCLADGTPFYTKDWSANYPLLHTGNKPTCTYTGNGDASNFRLVATGGIGDGCIVRSSNGVAIVTGSCVSILSGNSAVTDNSATWQNGELGMFSNHSVLNAIGVIYTCHVI